MAAVGQRPGVADPLKRRNVVAALEDGCHEFTERRIERWRFCGYARCHPAWTG